jgi:hypothetical protein
MALHVVSLRCNGLSAVGAERTLKPTDDALQGGGAFDPERAADPLHRVDRNPELLGDDPHTGPVRLAQGFLDSLFQGWGDRRPSKLLSFSLGPRQARPDALLDDASLELGEHAQHLEHGLAGRVVV